MTTSHDTFPQQAGAAAGFLSILIAPLLLALSALLNSPFLLFGTVILIFPLLRLVFGIVQQGPVREWRGSVATALEILCLIYVAAIVGALIAVLARLSIPDLTPAAIIGWILSLWMACIFATCVSHELLHRRGKLNRLAGHVLAGIAGYPILGYEHGRHHRLPGNTAAAEWPRLDESFWSFGLRRLRTLLPEALGSEGQLVRGDPRSPSVRGLRTATVTTLLTATAFITAAGWRGLLIFVGVVILDAWSIQLVTFMQHWGLGDDSCEDARAAAYAWENDCQYQAWVTVSLSLHHSHHQQGTLPYYCVGLAPNSPRLPLGYVLLMFAAFVPPMWRRLMAPALIHWKSHPMNPVSTGRRLMCVNLYK